MPDQQNECSNRHQVDIFTAIRTNDLDALRYLLANGADPNITNDRLETPLYVAARTAGRGCIRALVQAGANVNTRLPRFAGDVVERCHGSALNHAIHNKRIQEAMCLLECGADPRITDDTHSTALHFLVTMLADCADESENDSYPNEFVGHAHRLLEQLLDKGVPIDQVDDECESALQRAIVLDAPLSTIELLLLRGADSSLRCSLGNTVMHKSWDDESAETLCVLSTFGAEIDARDARGCTAVFHAADMAALAVLAALGANFHMVDNLGRTALHHHVLKQLDEGVDEEILGYLLIKGLDSGQKDYSGQSVDEILVHHNSSSAPNQTCTEIRAFLGAMHAEILMQQCIAKVSSKPDHQ